MCRWWLQREKQQYARNHQLIAALLRDDTKTALALVNAGADPNARQTSLPAPTLQSLLNRLLHRSPPPVNDSPTAFMLACGYLITHDIIVDPIMENTPLVEAMFAHGANVNALDENKRAPLSYAAESSHLHTVELLLQHRADPNHEDIYGETALIEACYGENAAGVVAIMLAHGANPNLPDKYGRTALKLCEFERRHDLIRLMEKARKVNDCWDEFRR